MTQANDGVSRPSTLVEAKIKAKLVEVWGGEEIGVGTQDT